MHTNSLPSSAENSGACGIPAEWAKQDAVLMCWPHVESDWQTLMPAVEKDFAHLAAAISTQQDLLILCKDLSQQRHVLKQLKQQTANLATIHIIQQATDDVWCRDYGPLTIGSQAGLQLLDFQFNGWGNRYAHSNDNQVNQALSEKNWWSTQLQSIDCILEGGSIDSNGDGVILTTEQCLLQANRNHTNKQQLESTLQEVLSIKQIHWLKRAWLAGDDTDGHVDNLARFVAPDTIVYATCDDHNDEHYASSTKLKAELETMATCSGKPYKLLALPLPRAVYSQHDKRRLPASYVNFLIINGAVLVPQFNDPNDEVACSVMHSVFPDRTIVPIPALGFIEQYGGIHCLCMTLPAGTVNLKAT